MSRLLLLLTFLSAFQRINSFRINLADICDKHCYHLYMTKFNQMEKDQSKMPLAIKETKKLILRGYIYAGKHNIQVPMKL